MSVNIERKKKNIISKKIIVISFLAIFILPVVVYLYATKFEPKSILTTWNDIENSNIPDGFHNIKIVQLSDTHLGPNFTLQQLQGLVEQINILKPDIVVFTGDLIDHFGTYHSEREQAKAILSQICAPLGKYAVFGNHDRGGGGSRLYKKYMEEAGFTVLVNEVKKITVANGNHITVSGLDDFLLGKPQIQRTLQQLRSQDFNLLLVHEPDVADQIRKYPVDFQISGHSHGGQVQIPFIGPIVTTSLAEKYVEGLYLFKDRSKPLQLYVNRGIGTTRMPLRFLSKPELSVFVLKRTNKEI
ncbi:metallophosphoesterase [Bacillus sp. DX4.1]|uniref:metallophosphoesterase n=1 Tax=Bacillus sp. DX4.1 TaxID=3055867 RepID=UPI0025A040C6|nr:metallophosphoesterase [Bacillus sp. DX4.1]MDM5189416.1 metallophosphoesterase [Bacillus sp. DX4.1]